MASNGKRVAGAPVIPTWFRAELLNQGSFFVQQSGPAEEVAQDVFLQLWRNSSQYDAARGTQEKKLDLVFLAAFSPKDDREASADAALACAVVFFNRFLTHGQGCSTDAPKPAPRK